MMPRSAFSFLAFPALVGLLGATPIQALPYVTPKEFTIVQGDVDAVLVSEFALGNGCAEVLVDSIVRRSPTLLGSRSSATVYWTYSEPKLDSASAVPCQNVRRQRRVDSIPRIEFYPVLPEAAIPFLPTVVRVDPDSVFECLGGSCARVATGIVQNSLDYSRCLDGMAAPAPSADSALSWLRRRLSGAQTIYSLQQMPVNFQVPPCFLPLFPVEKTGMGTGARALSTGGILRETRLQIIHNSWMDWVELFPVGERWGDTSITNDLALHRSANAGDYFSPETLRFSVQALRAPVLADPPTIFAYPTGLFADKYDRWLFAPSGSGSLVDEFRHGASLGYGSSWPISNDTVFVAGWGIPLERVLATTSIRSVVARPALRAVVHSGAVELELPLAARVDLVTPSGRRLESRDLPAGTSRLSLGGYHGMLLARAAGQIARLLAP